MRPVLFSTMQDRQLTTTILKEQFCSGPKACIKIAISSGASTHRGQLVTEGRKKILKKPNPPSPLTYHVFWSDAQLPGIIYCPGRFGTDIKHQRAGEGRTDDIRVVLIKSFVLTRKHQAEAVMSCPGIQQIQPSRCFCDATGCQIQTVPGQRSLRV